MKAVVLLSGGLDSATVLAMATPVPIGLSVASNAAARMPTHSFLSRCGVRLDCRLFIISSLGRRSVLSANTGAHDDIAHWFSPMSSWTGC